MYCLSRYDNLKNKIIDLDYIPVGLGSEKYSDGWLLDSTGKNISHKNSFYGEYTFHYWFWKNELVNIPNDTWIGFCAYRRFWSKNKNKVSKINNLKNEILRNISSDLDSYDVILGDRIDLTNLKWMKVIKYGKISFLRNPSVIFKNKRNIRFHFDMFHGNGILDKAIEQLDSENKEDFKNFVYKETSFNQGNMFICKSKEIIEKYYSTIFKWLENCEKIFGFDLEGYGKKRLYGFLAERFLSYWFRKNSNYIEWPILFYDLYNEN